MAAFHLFGRTLPIHFALLGRERKYVKSKTTAKLIEKRTRIAAVLGKLGQFDTFPTHLLSRCRLPLICTAPPWSACQQRHLSFIADFIWHPTYPRTGECGCRCSEPAPHSPSDPVQQTSRIQKQQQKRGDEKKFVAISFFVATNFTKFKIILFLKCWRKEFGPVFKEL